jgi:hypothetical protein
MAKKEAAAHEVRITRSELEKLPKNEQRRYMDLGYVVDDEPKKADSK